MEKVNSRNLAKSTKSSTSKYNMPSIVSLCMDYFWRGVATRADSNKSSTQSTH